MNAESEDVGILNLTVLTLKYERQYCVEPQKDACCEAYVAENGWPRTLEDERPLAALCDRCAACGGIRIPRACKVVNRRL